MSQIPLSASVETTSGRPPGVSVIIPVYNSAAYIAEALESVFGQTYRDFEVIVVDDGSLDAPELEKAMEPWHGRLICLRQANAGPSAARNAGIGRARGSYLAFLDSDDVWMPEHLAVLMRMFDEHAHLDLVYGNMLLFGDGVAPGLTYMQVCPSRGAVTVDSLISETCSVPTSCTVVRRQAALEAGLFDERFVRSEDFDLWLRIALRNGAQDNMAYVTDVLTKHRIRSGSLAADEGKLNASAIEVLEKIDRAFELPAATRSLIRAKQRELRALSELRKGKQCLSEGDLSGALEHLSEANVGLRRTKLTVLVLALRTTPRIVRLAMALRNRLTPRRQSVLRRSGAGGTQ